MTVRPDPIRAWREEYARRVLSIDFRPLSDAPFHASVEPIVADLRMVRAAFGPGVTFRDQEMARDGDDALGLMISRSSNIQITHRGRDLRLGQGDATLLHVCSPGRVGSQEHFGYIGVMIPQVELEARGTRLIDAVMQRLPRRSEVLKLLRGYIRFLEASPVRARADARTAIQAHIFDLVAMALTMGGAVGESSVSAVVASRRAAALAQIAAYFQDPEISIAKVADSQGISPRYLQRLLEGSGKSFTEHVTELRLQRVLTLLCGPDPRRISDIALDAGFSDISHFNRLFRSFFGDTPRGVRARGRIAHHSIHDRTVAQPQSRESAAS